MNWTTEWPKEPGWYWVSDPMYPKRPPEIVRCEQPRMAHGTYGGILRNCEGMPLYEFYGPIEPPAREQANACETSKSPKNA